MAVWHDLPDDNNGALTTWFSFDDTDGAYPYAGLLLGKDGNFYGTTVGGGANDAGTIFRMTTNGALATLASLNYSGAWPVWRFGAGHRWELYGTATYGGIYGMGAVSE